MNYDDDFDDDFNEIDFDFDDVGDTSGSRDQKESANHGSSEKEVNDFPDCNDFVDGMMDEAGEPDQDELDMLEEVPEGLNPAPMVRVCNLSSFFWGGGRLISHPDCPQPNLVSASAFNTTAGPAFERSSKC